VTTIEIIKNNSNRVQLDIINLTAIQKWKEDLLYKFLGVKSHSKRIKTLSLLKKSEKFEFLNKNSWFLLFFLSKISHFWSEIHFKKGSEISFLWNESHAALIQKCMFSLFFSSDSILILLKWDFQDYKKFREQVWLLQTSRIRDEFCLSRRWEKRTEIDFCAALIYRNS